MVEDKHRRPEVYQRLIEAGGGKTISLPRGSSRNKEVFVDCITHVIVDTVTPVEVQMFARAGVPCLHPEYLAEFLFQVHPRIKPYLITDQQKQKEETRIDEIKKSCKKVPRVYLGNSRTELLTSTSQVPSPTPEVRGQQHTPSCSSASPSKGSKRKLQLRQDIAGTLEMRKRRKMVHHQPCVPPWVRSSYKTFKSKDNQSAVPFTQAQQYIIDASIEEKQVLDAIVTVESYISTKHYPPAQLQHVIMQLILKTKDNWLAVACIKVLQSTLCMHGPALNPQMTEVYLDALLDGPREVRALHKYITTCDHWDFLYIVIKLAGCKRYSLASKEPTTSQADDGSPVDEAHNNAVLLLEFLTYQIEEDFTAWKNRKEYKLPISNCGCMIARIIWPASRKRYPSRLLTMPFKQLIKNVMKNLVKTEVPVAFGDTKFKILKHLLSLLNMAAEYCTYETQQCTTELNLAGSLVTEFSMAVASQIIDSGIHDNPEKLSLLLSLLQPQWLKLNVMQGILDRRHQSILETREAERLQSMPLTMNKI
ncbi:putative ankyrin repeat domain-containing protein 32-like, partial [Apostichopus japonicus]